MDSDSNSPNSPAKDLWAEMPACTEALGGAVLSMASRRRQPSGLFGTLSMESQVERLNRDCEQCRQYNFRCSGDKPVCEFCKDCGFECSYSDRTQDRLQRESSSQPIKSSSLMRRKDVNRRRAENALKDAEKPPEPSEVQQDYLPRRYDRKRKLYSLIGSNEIRLLFIYPSSERALPKCGLCTFGSDETPEYEFWFSAIRNTSCHRLVICDGQLVGVGDDLYNALSDLSRLLWQLGDPKPHYLWIDTLCINQKDLIEKRSQIKLMKKIHERARKVLILPDRISSNTSDLLPSQGRSHLLANTVHSGNSEKLQNIFAESLKAEELPEDTQPDQSLALQRPLLCKKQSEAKLSKRGQEVTMIPRSTFNRSNNGPAGEVSADSKLHGGQLGLSITMASSNEGADDTMRMLRDLEDTAIITESKHELSEIIREDLLQSAVEITEQAPSSPLKRDTFANAVEQQGTECLNSNLESGQVLQTTIPEISPSSSLNPSQIHRLICTLANSFGHLMVAIWKATSCEPVQPGYRRVEWICECGEALCGDFDNSRPEAVNAVVSALVRPHESSGSGTGASLSTTTIPEPIHIEGNNNPRSWSSTTQNGYSSVLDTTISDLWSYSPQEASVTRRYFELCINHSSLEKRLGEIDVSRVTNDGELFRKIREQYLNIRGCLAKRINLRKPVDIHYVRFTLEDRHRVWVFEKPWSWPPKEEISAERWDFEHPIDPPPPMPASAFLHYLKSSKPHHKDIWLSRLPKKLAVSMLQEEASLPSAWGINIIEGPDKAAILLLLSTALFVSLLVAIVWSVYKNDAAGGMAIGTYLVAIIAIIGTFLAARWQNL
ncbi:hypothetical protein MMC13_004307 [Lambiella insularis]|nr:hypothetical protein [Lambiella insularis]